MQEEEQKQDMRRQKKNPKIPKKLVSFSCHQGSPSAFTNDVIVTPPAQIT